MRSEWENLLGDQDNQRQRMFQQQKENNYRTDYGQDTPMIDGLAGFEFMGFSLDVEACLQAQVWRLQQQHERDEGGETSIQNPSATESTRPWRNMEQLTFSITVGN